MSVAAAQDAVDRNAHEVQVILQGGRLEFAEQGHTFSCASVKHGHLGVRHIGCVAEVACSCPRKQMCKHLEAAAIQRPFTHAGRLVIAQEIAKEGGVKLLDAVTGTAMYT